MQIEEMDSIYSANKDSVAFSSDVDGVASEDKKSSFLMNFFNLTNCIIGSGIIALPDATQKAGLALSLDLACVAALVTAFTSYLVVLVARRQNKRLTYPRLVLEVLGKKGYWIIVGCNTFLPISLSIIYGVVISDNIRLVLENFLPQYTLLQNRYLMQFLVLFGVGLPLSIPKHISILQHVSMGSVMSVVFYVCVFIYKTTEISDKILVLPEFHNYARSGVAQALSTISLAFMAHHNILLIYHSLRKNTIRRFSISIHLSILFVAVLYGASMVCGYMSFTGVVSSNMLNSYCVNDTLIVVTRIIFSLSILATLPMQILAAREAIGDTICEKFRGNRYVRYAITLVIFVFVYLVGLVSTNIDTVMEVGGALTATPMIMIFPPLLYLAKVQKSYRRLNLVTVVCWIMILMGVLLSIIGSVTAIMDAVMEDNSYLIPRYWCDNVTT